jgi:hypothetical protein
MSEHTISTMQALMAQGAAIVELQEEIAALKAERDRLQAALEEILHAIEALPGDGWSDGGRCKQIARRVLEERS